MEGADVGGGEQVNLFFQENKVLPVFIAHFTAPCSRPFRYFVNGFAYGLFYFLFHFGSRCVGEGDDEHPVYGASVL